MKTEHDSISLTGCPGSIRLLGVELLPSGSIIYLGMERNAKRLGYFLGQQEQKLPKPIRRYVWGFLAMAYCFMLISGLWTERRGEEPLNHIQIPVLAPSDTVRENRLSFPLEIFED
ncbi:hypothetical protein [Arthrospiribacter ruber]|uniref:Uncharacterized protein n=1 Tax=Arthrospiribacter ruber TaxID=2487934 RepID=A0A951MBJ6_9BACT|nr:hypothetical protein [Arthrospiribacter ruber]MBW3466842.1 hypothetical protein [Arthrospiribacter ruber]